jgi:diacylglycerol kinase (ATP)
LLIPIQGVAKSYFSVPSMRCKKKGIAITASYPVRHPDRLPEGVKAAIRHKGDLVIVGGGDGTISSIIDYFAYQDVVFGLLPLGTGNSFARTLGNPLTLEGAIDIIANGKVVDVDLGKVNDDYFANVISIGFPADLARNTYKSWSGMQAGLLLAASSIV